MSNAQSSKQKHILFLVSSMQGGGAERVAALLCNDWVNRGYAVTLMPTFSGKGECCYPLDSAVQLDYLADHIDSTRKTPWSMIKRLLILRKIIKESHVDLVVSFLTHVNVATLLATRGLATPIIVSERIHPPKMSLSVIWRWGRKFSYRWATQVIAQTQETAHWLQKNCQTTKLSIIPNPVVYPLPMNEPALNPEAYFNKKQHLIIAVGRLNQQKGFDLLINSFASLSSKYSDWHLVILGEGTERQALEAQRNQLGLNDQIHLLGHAGNLRDWYQRADFYVMSSRFEGFPNTLLETMAHGLAAVSFDCDTGPRDIIQTGTNGVLVSLHKGEAGLATALEQLIKDKDLRLKMGAEASKVQQRYSMEKISVLWDKALDLSN